MTKVNALATIKTLFTAAFFVIAVSISGCGVDAITGPEQADGPSMQTSSNPHDSQPGNDDCSVGGC